MKLQKRTHERSNLDTLLVRGWGRLGRRGAGIGSVKGRRIVAALFDQRDGLNGAQRNENESWLLWQYEGRQPGG